MGPTNQYQKKKAFWYNEAPKAEGPTIHESREVYPVKGAYSSGKGFSDKEQLPNLRVPRDQGISTDEGKSGDMGCKAGGNFGVVES